MRTNEEIQLKIKEINEMVFNSLLKSPLDTKDDHGAALWGMYCNALRWVLEEG